MRVIGMDQEISEIQSLLEELARKIPGCSVKHTYFGNELPYTWRTYLDGQNGRPGILSLGPDILAMQAMELTERNKLIEMRFRAAIELMK